MKHTNGLFYRIIIPGNIKHSLKREKSFKMKLLRRVLKIIFLLCVPLFFLYL